MLAPFTSVETKLPSLIQGECFFDAETRDRYSTAASWYKIQPVGVVLPRDVTDIQAVVRYCAENEIPLIARGAGTGLAGQAVGMGIIIDFTRWMNHIEHVRHESATVQSGVILGLLNHHLASQGVFFPVDPASGSLCTIGGMIATNAAGAHGLKYGATKDNILSLDVVLSTGEVATISGPCEQTDESSTLASITRELEALLLPRRDLIVSRFPRVAKNSSGYNLLDATAGKHLDLRKLLVGSEGTLALVVGATLKLMPLPRYRTGTLAYFVDYESTVEATMKALELQPAAIEILDRTYFSLGKGLQERVERLLRQEAQTMLYFEFEGDDQKEIEDQSVRLTAMLEDVHPLAVVTLNATMDRSAFWRLREEVSKQLNLSDTFGKSSFIEDVAVPVAALPQYVRGLSAILNRYGIRFSAYGHAGSGNIHCATFVDLTNPEHYRAIDRIASEVAELAISLGGTLSGEHGDGYVRTPFLERLYGEEVYQLFRDVKRIFDPQNIFNPGKIIGHQRTTILHDLTIV
jgi:FAD/FMN-containing dehydrogenase